MHGKSADPDGIVVGLERKGDQLEAELEDGGVEFNPLHQPDPEIGGTGAPGRRPGRPSGTLADGPT
jgi:hypothetical protein